MNLKSTLCPTLPALSVADHEDLSFITSTTTTVSFPIQSKLTPSDGPKLTLSGDKRSSIFTHHSPNIYLLTITTPHLSCRSLHGGMIARSLWQVGLTALSLLTLSRPSFAADAAATRYITTVTSDGSTVYLADDRRPALYTGNFGDCLGSSSINVTRFDAAYYKDNMTILFHLEGNSAIAHESLMSKSTLCCPRLSCTNNASVYWSIRLW